MSSGRMAHLDYSAKFLIQINATLMLSLERQLNWALKRTYFRSKFKSSSLLRISKSFKGIELRSYSLYKSFLPIGKARISENLGVYSLVENR